MYLKVAIPFIVLLGACCALDFRNYLPGASGCGLSYGNILKKRSWVCEDSQFQVYPKAKVEDLLAHDTSLENESEFLSITKGCQEYHDNSHIYGENEHYTYESICKLNRKPVRVIWATVPHWPVPANLMNLNNGLLPVHVLEGQSLFDVECTHPWANGVPPHLPRRMRRRLMRIRFNGVKRHLCLAGYAYNYNLMCKPTGFMSREVLVYSEHANRIFSVVVPDVPTSCACAYCSCHHIAKKQQGHGLPAVV